MTATTFKALFHSHAGFAALILRVPLGLTFIAHGAQKLFAWFGGYGLQGTGQWMTSIGLEPGYLMALLAGSAEFFGGLALVLGLCTRLSAFVTAFTMLIAMFSVHIQHGFFMANNGYEYALILMVSSLALTVQGGGTWSLDTFITRKIASQN